MSQGTILVTGGTGLLGSHVISQLLEKGYTVRATARSTTKLQSVKFPKVPSERLEIVEVPSLTADHSEALKGVTALIHTAAQLFGEGIGSKEIFTGVYEGALNIVKQAIAAGVKKIIVTGTYGTLFDSSFEDAYGTRVITEKDIGSVTMETINLDSDDGVQIYREAKTLAEKELWKLAHEHPDVDFTTILPPAIFGPQITPLTSSPNCLSSNVATKILLGQKYPTDPWGHMIDVRDIARAHVLALHVPPVPGRDKRFIVVNKTFTWKDVADIIRSKRPELADRLPKETATPVKQSSAPLDTSFARDVLGMTNYIPAEDSFLASLDVALDWEEKFGKEQ